MHGRVWHVSLPAGLYAICTDMQGRVVAAHNDLGWMIGLRWASVVRLVYFGRGTLTWALIY